MAKTKFDCRKHFDATSELVRALEAAANRLGMSESELIRKCLRENEDIASELYRQNVERQNSESAA